MNKPFVPATDTPRLRSYADPAGRRTWQLNRGSLRGVADGDTVVVKTESKRVTGRVAAVFQDRSTVRFDDDPRLNELEAYPATLRRAAGPVVTVAVEDETAWPEGVLAEMGKIDGLGFTEDMAAADYRIRVSAGQARVEYPGAKWRGIVLVAPISVDNQRDRAIWMAELGHIIAWHRLAELTNPDTRFSTFPIELKLAVKIGAEIIQIPAPNGETSLPYPKNEAGDYFADLKVSLKNTFHRRMYTSFMVMGSDFSSHTRLFKQEVFALDAGQEIKIFPTHTSAGTLTVRPQPSYLRQDRPSDTIVFKVIASTEETALRSAVQGYASAGLPLSRETTRGGEATKPTALTARADPDWSTRTVRLELVF